MYGKIKAAAFFAVCGLVVFGAMVVTPSFISSTFYHGQTPDSGAAASTIKLCKFLADPLARFESKETRKSYKSILFTAAIYAAAGIICGFTLTLSSTSRKQEKTGRYL